MRGDAVGFENPSGGARDGVYADGAAGGGGGYRVVDWVAAAGGGGGAAGGAEDRVHGEFAPADAGVGSVSVDETRAARVHGKHVVHPRGDVAGVGGGRA